MSEFYCPECQGALPAGARKCECGWKQKKNSQPITPDYKCASCGSEDIYMQIATKEKGADGHWYHVIKLSLCYEHTHVQHRNWRDNMLDHYMRHQDIEAAREYAMRFETNVSSTPRPEPTPERANETRQAAEYLQMEQGNG